MREDQPGNYHQREDTNKMVRSKLDLVGYSFHVDVLNEEDKRNEVSGTRKTYNMLPFRHVVDNGKALFKAVVPYPTE